MPYIGRNHIAGDHTSNFKVLDDISSYTATFDGSATSIVSTADETIRIPEHRFIQGQRVTYTNGGGGNIGGLTSGTAYFVSFDSANTIKLATTLANANSNTVINLSSVGSGTSHTLNAAFDGINTQFKATYNSGDVVNINNSTQLQIAINNVIQKPNIDSSYTEGFLVVDSRKIQFKTAPTVDDIFWGSILANTIETFDISDLKIDNFTGDGSTTQYTLSRDVPNNQSIMVTLDGVTQHASDNSTARSYSLVTDTIIQFTAAPGNGVEIQVRHLGFAGASTGDVSGFYGRTGNVTLSSSDHITTGDITSRNINSSGIVTASSFSGSFSGNIVGTSATFTGNLSVGGVLTYEDVTNVDSVGIITAQKDIHVGAGVSAVGVGTFGSLDIGGDIDVDGHTNLDNVSVAGVSTFSGNADFSSGVDVTGTITGNNLTLSDNDPELTFTDLNNNPDYRIKAESGNLSFEDTTNGNAARLRINADGHVDVTGNLDVGAGIDVTGNIDANGDLDVDGHTNLDNVSIAGVSTFSSTITAATVNATGGSFTGNLRFSNNVGTLFGASDELQVFHNSGTSYITHNGSGQLQIRAKASEQGIKIFPDGAVELYHNNIKRLETSSVGVSIPQDLDVDGHTNLDNVSIAGIVTALNFVKTDGTTVGGAMTGYNNDPGENNVTTLIAGRDAGNNIQLQNSDGQSAFGNVLIGDGAGKFAQNGYDYNVAVGSYAHNKLRDGSYNIAIGYRANPNVSTQVSSNTIAIGYETLVNFVGGGTAVTNGRNTVVGHAAAGTLVSGGNNLVLGMSADVSSANISNEITLGNTSINHLRVPGIGVSFSAGGAVISGIVTATSFSGDGSALTGISAGTSLSGSTNNTVCTVTGANAIQGESNVQIDSNGRLLIGTTTAGESNGDEATFANTGGNAGITIRSAVDSECKIYFSEGTSGGSQYRGAINYNQNTNYMAFSANEYERMRIQDDGDVKITDGDLVIGTSGHGIDFSATADGTGSNQAEILDDYEEGYWSPTVTSSNASFSTETGRYTKIGNQVTLWCKISGGSGYSGSSALTIGGIPFANNTPFNPIGTSEYYKIDFARDYTDHVTPYLAGQNLQWLRNNSGGGSGNYLTINLFYSGAAIQTVITYMTSS